MRSRFFKGVLIGGAIGAAVVAKWDTLSGKCSFLDELKEKMRACDLHMAQRETSRTAKPRTRLMARRHRVKKEY